jgi:lipoprotein-releasing system permease protein
VGLTLILAHTNLISLPADVYYIDHLPVKLDPLDIAVVVLAAIAIVFIATLFPSRKATEIDPIEAIRYG